MSKTTKTWLIIAAAVLIVGLAWYFLIRPRCCKKNQDENGEGK